jgi:HK97 family phage portal protein
MVPANQMLHICGPLSDDGYCGRSVIGTFREALGLGLATERYAGEFFANAATPRGLLTTPNRLSAGSLERLSLSLSDKHSGAGRRHKTLVLEEDLKFQPLGISHEDSQFIEVRRFGIEEIARVFGVPPAMIGAEIKGSMTYSNAETRALDYLKFCLGPHLARIAAAVNHACLSPVERRQAYAEYLPDALLATDTTGRYTAYKTGLEAGFLTIDEVRKKENLPALPERVPTV